MVRSKAEDTTEVQDEAGAEPDSRTPPVEADRLEEPTLTLRRMRGLDKTKCLIPGCVEPLVSSSSQRTLVCSVHCVAPFVVLEPARGRLRFCQKCAKLQQLSDFDAEKRTCRRMLQRHNDRRREKYRQRKEQAAATAPDDGAGPSQEPEEEEAAAAGVRAPSGGRAPPGPLRCDFPARAAAGKVYVSDSLPSLASRTQLCCSPARTACSRTRSPSSPRCSP
jgi:SBP domain